MNIPGIPAGVASAASGIISGALSLLSSDAASLLSGLFGGAQWGIYLGGIPVVLADNCVSIDYRQSWQVSDYPKEKGAFESYDKVATPFDAMVRLSAGGSSANREAFLASIDAIAGTLMLFDVVTPEKVYSSCNITRQGLVRHATHGVSLITVDIALVEVRVTATANSTTQDPTSAAQSNSGPVQTTSTPAAAPTQSASSLDNIGGGNIY